MAIEEVTPEELTAAFKEKIGELQEEPEFQWNKEKMKYALDKNGEADVKLAVANIPLDYDLWEGLRNPAVVGLFPVGLGEIWEFYANRRKQSIDEYGRKTIFQIPRSFAFARANYSRAVIISVMLPFSQRVIGDYTQLILGKGKGSSHLYSRMLEDVNLMINKATSRVGIDLVTHDNAVVAMDSGTAEKVSAEAVPLTHQGSSHGPSLGGNYPQKSIAVLAGLGQFGIQRMVFRDEFLDGRVQRSIGPIRSIIVFDQEEVAKDGSCGVIYPTNDWREFLLKLFDFTNIDPQVNQYRFCSYIPQGDKGCGKCISCCPSGAQRNSAPSPTGGFPEEISKQTHRFWEGKLRFDFARCCEERGQMGTLFSEWACSRCVSICGAQGNRRAYAAENFYEKMHELTTDEK